MPIRKRNYKAEYAAQKKRATDAGYTGVTDYKRTRKRFGLGRAKASLIPKRIAQLITPGIAVPISQIRKENAEWSAEHSRVPNSKWHGRFSDERAIRYWNAFVTYYGSDDGDKLHRIEAYVRYYGLVTDETWRSDYLGIR